MINNKYEIESYISQGSFGNVYKCKYNNKYYAVKEDKDLKTLKYEAQIYKELKSVKNISTIVDFFLFDNKHYIVLELYEFNLTHYKLRFENSESYYDNLKIIFTGIIKTLEHIHELGIVHRDLKPTNICLDKNYNPYIIDFGLAKKIITNNKHIKEKKINNIIGSYNFISLNVLNLIEPSRRDDMESLIFILLYMILAKETYIKYDNLIQKYKKDIAVIEITLMMNEKKVPYKNIMSSIRYIRKLNFTQKPNYEHFISTLLLEITETSRVVETSIDLD